MEGARTNISAMRKPDVNTHGLIRRLSVVALALWLGGFGCLFGCERHSHVAVAAATAQMTTAPAAHDAMTHGCCHAKKDHRVASSSAESNSETDAGLKQCPFNTPAVDSARRTAVQSPAAIPAQGRLAHAPILHASFAPPDGRARAPDRGGTYLRCCVFLI
jgi:hypothetical protein